MKGKLVLALAVVCMLALPAATASHFVLSRLDRDIRDDTGISSGYYDSIGEWTDEGSDSMPEGAPGAGLDERLVREGGAVNEGTDIVLDSRFVTSWWDATFDPNHYSRETLNREVLWPGTNTFFAWYGTWDDKNNNDIIDNYYGRSGVEGEEFEWHGAVKGKPYDALNMVAWVWPSNPHVGCSAPGLSANNCRGSEGPFRTLGAFERNESRKIPSFSYADRTTGGDGVWLAENGWMTTFVDESLLMTTHVLTVANATILAGSEQRYRIEYESPGDDQLRDVDRYESLDGGTEGLYLATADFAIAVVDFADTTLAPVISTLAPILAPVNSILAILDDADPFLGDVDDVVWPGYAQGITCDDCDFKASWQPYLNLRLATVEPTMAVMLPDGTQTGIWGYSTVSSGVSPGTSEGGDRSNLPGYMIGQLRTGWHFDKNGDGWIGVACDTTDPDEIDDNGECLNPYEYGNRDDPNRYNDADEFLGECGFTRLDVITVTPVTAWPPGTFLAVQFNRAGGATFGEDRQPFEPLTGAQTAVLRMDNLACGGGDFLSYTKDAILSGTGTHLGDLAVSVTIDFPAGEDVGLETPVPAVTLTHTIRMVSSL